MNTAAAIRISLAQMRCEKADVEDNLATVARYLQQAMVWNADIVAFPEMCLGGYADPTRYPEAVMRLDGPEVGRLLQLTQGYQATVLAGLIEENPSGKPFITQLVARDGQLLGSYRKVTIEDEELDWFSAGDAVPVFGRGALTFGIAICADIGNRAVFEACAAQGAKIVFEVAAPGLYGEQETRDWQAGYTWWEGECQKHLSVYARELGMWIAVATQAGRTIDEDFPGGGYLFDPGGRRRWATENWAGYIGAQLVCHQRVRTENSDTTIKIRQAETNVLEIEIMYLQQTNIRPRKCSATAVLLIIACSFDVSTLQAGQYTFTSPANSTGNNFTMVDPANGLVGGTNDVVFTWDGTLNDAVGGAVSNATLSSDETFFGSLWDAHDVTLYGPGTYTVYDLSLIHI